MKKSILLILTITVTLLTNTIHAQWLSTNGPSGGTIKCLVANGSNIFAGTESNGVFLSTNNGSSWTAVNIGLPASTTVLSLAINGANIFAGTN